MPRRPCCSNCCYKNKFWKIPEKTQFFLFFNKILQALDNIFLDLLDNLPFAAECKKFAFVTFHVGKHHALLALDKFDIEFSDNFLDDRPGCARGNKDIE